MLWWQTILLVLGIILGVVIFVILLGKIIFWNSVRSAVNQLFETQEAGSKPDYVTEKDLERLPKPAQRYMRYTGVVGQEKVRSVRLRQKGFFRLGPGRRLMPFHADQYFTVDSPGFVWYGNIEPVPFLAIKARDMYYKTRGSMLVRLLGLLKVVDQSGRYMNEAALLRYLSETIWFPTALLSDNVTWEEVDENTASASMTVRRVTVTAFFHLGEKGELLEITAKRHMSVAGEFILSDWSIPVTEYREMNGMNIPCRGDATWLLEDDDYDYIKAEITEIEYNTPLLY